MLQEIQYVLKTLHASDVQVHIYTFSRLLKIKKGSGNDDTVILWQ